MTIAVLKKKMCMVKNILLILKQKNMKKFVFLFFYFLMVLNIHSQTNWSSFVAYHARNINDVFINDYNNICLVGGNKLTILFVPFFCLRMQVKHGNTLWTIYHHGQNQ
jgi:hypothetical protein